MLPQIGETIHRQQTLRRDGLFHHIVLQHPGVAVRNEYGVQSRG